MVEPFHLTQIFNCLLLSTAELAIAACCWRGWRKQRDWLRNNSPRQSPSATHHSLDRLLVSKGKVFYDQGFPWGESTTTACGVNYQLLTVKLLKCPTGNYWLQSTRTSYRQWRQLVDPIQFTTIKPPLTGQYSLSATCKVQIGVASVGNRTRHPAVLSCYRF